MAELKVDIPEFDEADLKKTCKNLYDTVIKLRKELEWVTTHLDEDNVHAVSGDWVYSGSITAAQINAQSGKIKTAQIEDLVVGGNVTMGTGARISWSNVDNQPIIPSQYTDGMAVDAFQQTYIDGNNVFTGNVYANKITGESFTALDNIKIGVQGSETIGKGLYFNNNSYIVNTAGTTSMTIATPRGLTLDCGTAYDLNIYGGDFNASMDGILAITAWSSSQSSINTVGTLKINGATAAAVILPFSSYIGSQTSYNAIASEGYVDDAISAVSVPSSTGSGGSHSIPGHNHGIADGTVLMKDGGGTVTWSAHSGWSIGSHSHSI